MNLQRERRANPYPLTWELPLGFGIAALLVLVLAVHPARAMANVMAGGGWDLTPRENLFTSLPAIVAGDSGAGLSSRSGQAAPALLLSTIGIVELMVLCLLGWAVRSGMRHWGPGRVRGMASADEAEGTLGRSRLSRSGKLVRPDLVSRASRREPRQLGWRLGTSSEPATGRELWVPWDRTGGVVGPQGSGKTLDLLAPALLSAQVVKEAQRCPRGVRRIRLTGRLIRAPGRPVPASGTMSPWRTSTA